MKEHNSYIWTPQSIWQDIDTTTTKNTDNLSNMHYRKPTEPSNYVECDKKPLEVWRHGTYIILQKIPTNAMDSMISQCQWIRFDFHTRGLGVINHNMVQYSGFSITCSFIQLYGHVKPQYICLLFCISMKHALFIYLKML
jgi:hypothetical protein